MTFQRKTALQTVELLRSLCPGVRVVVGGYDPSLAPEAYMADGNGIDYIVRGEGEVTFRELLRAIESGDGFDKIHGLSYRAGDGWHQNPARPVHSLEGDEIRLPKRERARAERLHHDGPARSMWWRPRAAAPSIAASVRSSRCAAAISTPIRSTACWPTSATPATTARAPSSSWTTTSRSTFAASRRLCHAIIDAGLNDIVYTVQAMTSPIAMHGETLAPLMRQAGFRYVFLGIENILEDDLAFLKAAAKNEFREDGRRTGNATLRAIDFLHKNKMYVVGGLIVGNPDDTRESIKTNLEFASKYVDWPYIQHPTPYPGTPMTKDFQARNLIMIERMEEYDGTTAVVATRASAAGGDRVRALARRALDEDAAHPGGDRARPAVRACATGGRCCRTPSAAARSSPCSAWRAIARSSSATRPCAAPSACICNRRRVASAAYFQLSLSCQIAV